jgi:hypothetical protein
MKGEEREGIEGKQRASLWFFRCCGEAGDFSLDEEAKIINLVIDKHPVMRRKFVPRKFRRMMFPANI